MRTWVLAHIDKTVVKISGVEIKGLRPVELEKALNDYLGRPVRVIGVTGVSIEMDMYGVEPDAIFRDEAGIVRALSAVEGINGADVIKISSVEKVKEIPLAKVPKGDSFGCARERWRFADE